MPRSRPLTNDTQEFNECHVGLFMALLSLSIAARARQIASAGNAEDHEWRHVHSLLRRLGAAMFRSMLGAAHPHKECRDGRIFQGDSHRVRKQCP